MNLLRVFSVVVETGSVTEAAKRLYLTQPAVSASLRRLTAAVGAPLFVRSGRGLVLTSRGSRLAGTVKLYLQQLVDAALAPASFDPMTSERTVRIGITDSAELWLLPRLLRVLAANAPRMHVVVSQVQFRTVGSALAAGLDAALSVAYDLPQTIRRKPLYTDSFSCVYDPRHARFKKLTEQEYFAQPHVVVSYNGDLRGIVEDLVRKTRDVRCSVSSFAHIGEIVEGTRLLATVPNRVADHIRAVRPHLRKTPLPFSIDPGASPSYAELLWPVATDDDDACRFVRAEIEDLARSAERPEKARRENTFVRAL